MAERLSAEVEAYLRTTAENLREMKQPGPTKDAEMLEALLDAHAEVCRENERLSDFEASVMPGIEGLKMSVFSLRERAEQAEAERDKARSIGRKLVAERDRHCVESNRAYTEVCRLRRVVEAAEAEAARLREALRGVMPLVVIDWMWDAGGQYGCKADPPCREKITLESGAVALDRCYRKGFPHAADCPLKKKVEAATVALEGAPDAQGQSTEPNKGDHDA